MAETNLFYKYLINVRENSPAAAYRTQKCLDKLLENCGQINKEEVENYLLKRKGEIRASYLKSLISSARVYTHFLKENNLPHDPSILTIKYPKKEYVVKSVFSDEEIETILSMPPPYHVHKANWEFYSVFFTLCAYTGARPGEIAKLKIGDVDWGRNVFILRQTKTGHPRLVPIPHPIHTRFKAFLEGRDGYLFPSLRGGAKFGLAVIDNVDWHYNFGLRLKRLGLKRPGLTLYSLRHSMITRLLEEDVSITKVMKLAGHNRIQTTLEYTHITTKDIQLAVLKHPMIRKNTDPKYTLQAIKDLLETFELRTNDRLLYELDETGDSLRFTVKIKEPKEAPLP